MELIPSFQNSTGLVAHGLHRMHTLLQNIKIMVVTKNLLIQTSVYFML